MPLYEYECDDCGGRFERIQKFSDPPVETCPTCGGSVHKLISSPAIQFKGTGWYVTDYARKPSEGQEAAEGGGKNGESSSSESKESSKESSTEAPKETKTSGDSSSSSSSSSGSSK